MTKPREQIVVTITPDGAVVAETRGIKGTGCLDYITLLEDILEAETTSSHFTSEYTQPMQSITDEATNDLHQR